MQAYDLDETAFRYLSYGNLSCQFSDAIFLRCYRLAVFYIAGFLRRSHVNEYICPQKGSLTHCNEIDFIIRNDYESGIRRRSGRPLVQSIRRDQRSPNNRLFSHRWFLGAETPDVSRVRADMSLFTGPSGFKMFRKT